MLHFEKYHALGNDFILIDCLIHPPSLSKNLISLWCNRHFGIGGDGIIQILPPRLPLAVGFMRIYNSDGSLASLCINGFRCVAFWLLHQKRIQANQKYVLETDSGPKSFMIQDDLCLIDVGQPQWELQTIQPDGTLLIGLSIGNSHLVAYHPKEDLLLKADTLAQALSLHPWAHKKANVEIVKILAKNSIQIVVLEVGAGFTLACGSGAVACVAALTKLEKLEQNTDVEVFMPGGRLWVKMDNTQNLSLKGHASKIFEGMMAMGEEHANFSTPRT